MKRLLLYMLLISVLVYPNLGCVQNEHYKHAHTKKEKDKRAVEEEFVFRDTVDAKYAQIIKLVPLQIHYSSSHLWYNQGG